MSASLRIEIEPKGGVSPSSGSSSSVPPVPSSSSPISSSPIPLDRPRTFGEMLRERDEAAKKFREDAAKFRKETGISGTVTDAELRKRVQAEDRQERDENWLARQEARAAKNKEAELKRAEAMQNRDENWLARQEASEEKRLIKEREQASRKQKRDEDWFDREQIKIRNEEERKKSQQWWSNPANVAENINQRRQFTQEIGVHRFMQNIGFSSDSPVSRAVAGVATGFTSLTMRMAPLIAAAGALAGAWGSARRNLLEEGNRVGYFSSALRMQEVRNMMRDLRTDRMIAQEYGEQIAGVEDRENRQKNAWRLIGMKVSSAFEPVVRPLSEAYTQVLELLAGTHDMQRAGQKRTFDNIDYLANVLGKSMNEIKDMRVKMRDFNDIAEATRIAEDVLKMLGSSGFDENDPVKAFNDGPLYPLDPRVVNPGIFPSPLPRGWQG